MEEAGVSVPVLSEPIAPNLVLRLGNGHAPSVAKAFRSLSCGRSQLVLWKESACVAEGTETDGPTFGPRAYLSPQYLASTITKPA